MGVSALRRQLDALLLNVVSLNRVVYCRRYCPGDAFEEISS
jgi:hypothetical protein